MQGFINRDALLQTLFHPERLLFFIRSRSILWTKGETSTNFINVSDIFLDCDRGSIIYLGKPDGPTCHTGADTCYYTSVDDVIHDPLVDGNKLALTTLYSLESTISKRKEELSEDPDGKPSSTKRILLDEKLLCSKIGKKQMNCAEHWRKTRTRLGPPLKWLMFCIMPCFCWLVKELKLKTS